MKKIILVFYATLLHFKIYADDSQKIRVKLQSWEAEIDPSNLQLSAISNLNKNLILSSSLYAKEKFEYTKNNNDSYSIFYPEKKLKINIKPLNDKLEFTFVSEVEQTINWPSTKSLLDKSNKEVAENFILPNGEGLYLLVSSIFWKNMTTKYDAFEYDMTEQLSLPLFGITTQNYTISYLSASSLNNTIKINYENNLMYITQAHNFRKIDNFSPYKISIQLSNFVSPIEPAKIFRNEFLKENSFMLLKNKSLKNPEIKKLYGAIHAYAWGNGRDINTLALLENIGIKNLWIGYDEGENDKFKITKQYIDKAKNLGYLIGPYDTWENIQDPKKADTPLSIFPNAWPKAAVLKENLKPQSGFQNRGYEASSEYFALQNPKNKDLYERANKFIETGINSYFLDVDATGTLYDDYSADHPMNKEKDMQNRKTRMEFLSNNNLVLGSETAAYWAVPYIAFSHGTLAVFNNPHWKFSREKEKYGKWYPQEKPQFFFKEIDAPQDYKETKFNPIFRIPLFQVAFHDSIISTDRWEIPLTKFPKEINKRLMLEILYGVPSIWVLNQDIIKKHSNLLKKVSMIYSTFHKNIAELSLTEFQYLNKERTVQKTVFENEVEVISNFSEIKFEDIPKESIRVKYLKSGKIELINF